MHTDARFIGIHWRIWFIDVARHRHIQPRASQRRASPEPSAGEHFCNRHARVDRVHVNDMALLCVCGCVCVTAAAAGEERENTNNTHRWQKHPQHTHAHKKTPPCRSIMRTATPTSAHSHVPQSDVGVSVSAKCKIYNIRKGLNLLYTRAEQMQSRFVCANLQLFHRQQIARTQHKL